MFPPLLSLRRPLLLALATGLTAEATAAGLPAIDAPLQSTVVSTNYIFPGVEAEAFYWTAPGPAQSNQEQLARYGMPLDGSAPNKQSKLLPAGFVTTGTAQGLVYGFFFEPGDGFPDQFRALDATTLATVASHPITTQITILASLRQEDGGLVYFRSISGGLAHLLRFNAETRTISETTVDSVVATYSYHRLAGAGPGWLAFQCSNPLIDENKLVTVDATTFAKKAEANVNAYFQLEGVDASAGDYQFLIANSKVLAMNVHDGSSTIVGEGVPGAITQAYGIAAHGPDLWIDGHVPIEGQNASREVQLWRRNDSGQWQMEFRGKPQRSDTFTTIYPKMMANAHGAFVYNYGWMDYYVPASSKPILLPPAGFQLKDGGGVQEVVVKLDRPATEPLSVRVRNGAGTATAGSDFAAIDRMLNFPVGASEASFEVNVLADLVPESNETIELIFSEPQGLKLPLVRRGSLVIEASGLELTEVKFSAGPSNGTGTTVPAFLLYDPDVTVGIAAVPNASSPAKLCLWDTATGAMRGVTSLPANTTNEIAPEFIVTAEGLDANHRNGQDVVLTRLSRQTGVVQSTGSFLISGAIRDVVLLGGGRALVSYSPSGTFSTWSSRIISIGGAPEGVAFANAPMPGSGSVPAFICDNGYLAAGWDLNNSIDRKRSFLTVYNAATLAPLWEKEFSDSNGITPLAIRGKILLCGTGTQDRVLAIDLETQEILWQQTAEGGISAVGDTFWLGSDYDPAAYDLATGAPVRGLGYLGDSTSAENQVVAAGKAGIILSDNEYFAVPGNLDPGIRFRLQKMSTQRTRPAVQLLNQNLMQSHTGASIALRAVEKTNVPVQVSLHHIDSENIGFAKLTLNPAPVTLPQDGSVIGVPYKVQPQDGPPMSFLYATYRIAAKIQAAGLAPNSGQADIPMNSGIPVAPAQHGTVVASTPIQQNYPKYQGMRLSDGKLLAFTGKASGLVTVNNNHIDVLDAATGALIRRIVDPVPLPNRVFAINAIAQGDKLLVVSRMAGGSVGTAEIFQISTGTPLAVLTYKGALPGFGDTLASNPNHFAIAIPGMDLGKPAGSQVEAFNWSDYKRAFRKAGGKNSQFGIGMTFHGDTLYASATAKPKRLQERDPAKGKVFGFKVGTKAKGKIPVPLGTTGTLLEGGSSLIVGNFNDLRSYDWSTMQLKWSKPFPFSLEDYRLLVSAGNGMISVRDFRDLMLLSEADGSHVGTTRFYSAIDNAIVGDLYGAAISGDHVFTLQDGVVKKWPLTALGDFVSWRRFQGTTLQQQGPYEDYDDNGTPDFDDYVANRLNPSAPFATAVHQAGKVKVDSAVLPPPDVLVVVEAEVADGLWSAIAWREGHGGWAGPGGAYAATGSLLVNLPADSVAQPALRFRYLPSAAFGAAWGDMEWPPADRIEPSAALRAFASGIADSDGDGLPDWLEAQLGVQAGGAPLGIISGSAGSGVSFLRPLGGSAAFDVESSADLVSWKSAKDDDGLEITVVPEDAQYERVSIRGKAGVTQRFFRVKY